ncbi:MAG TPA: hypothetical protein PLJ00_05775 [Chitinophagales bacterium]|nr:hypothetical protein [Chitinophagales bacterium]
MQRIKVSPNFYLDEFVPKGIYDEFGFKSIIFVSQARIDRAEAMRAIHGPIIINNWATGGPLQDSGYRAPNSKTGAFYSQHKLNDADDYHFVKFNKLSKEAREEAYRKLRQEIIDSPELYLGMGITTIEDGTWSWLHCDGRNTTGIVPAGEIYVVPYR